MSADLLAAVDDARAAIVARYTGMPAEDAARAEGVPAAAIRDARAALGRDPEDGTARRPAAPEEAPGFAQIDRLMRTNRGTR